MEDKNKAFVLYKDYYYTLKDLTIEEYGQLFIAILAYVNNKPIEEQERNVAIAFSFVKQQLDRDAIKYAEKCEKNRQNVLKRYQKENDT